MTLHDAIVQILRQKGRPMSTSEIASELNRLKLYDKRDGSTITAFQVHGRTRKYDDLFTRSGSTVGLVGSGGGRQSMPRPNAPPEPISKTRVVTSLGTSMGRVHKISFLKDSGFTRVGELGALLQRSLPNTPELGSCGIYAITVPSGYSPKYLSPNDVRGKRNVVSPWSVERIEGKWVEGADIVYYGLAGSSSPRSLSARLRDLLEHGNGRTTDRGPHKGGEILWQLSGYEKFTLWVKPTDDPPVPRQTEEALLRSFHAITGQLPFANRKF